LDEILGREFLFVKTEFSELIYLHLYFCNSILFWRMG